MSNKKKLLITIISIIILAIALGALLFFTKLKNKELLLTLNKVYFAYSSYVLDIGKSPDSIDDLLQNSKNTENWDGPYLPKVMINNSKKQISIIAASNIPTKKCGLDVINNCYKWIMIKDISSSEFNKIQETTNNKSTMFFANNNLYFKVSIVE